ncbi:MAG: autotransporter outer membrane beta-barrel domain-containing protein [Sutterella parvirubra]|nr:autotransporter outer membrane beta-barrel domain-containing protein [Sutterella parvirubra]
MGAANGATAVNQGTIEADNAYGMYVGTGSGNSTITNDTTGVIVVTTQGAGMELGAVSGNKAINRGTITAGAPAAGEINKLKFTHGVLIQESSNNEFTNYGTIDATNGTSAIEVKKTGTDNNTINLEAGSRVLGLVHVDAAATNTTLNLKGMQGSLLLKVEAGSQEEGDHFTLNVKDGANVTLEDGQKSTIDVAKITNGTLTASIFQADNAFKTVNLEEQGVFNITALNSRTAGTAATDPANRLLLAFGANYKLEGGRLQVAGQDYTGALKIGTNSGTKGSGELTVVSGNYTFSDVEVAPKGTLTLEGGRLSVTNTLKATGGTVDPTRGAIKFTGGTLNIQGSQIFVNKGTGTDPNWEATEVVGLMSGSGVVELTDSFEYSLANLRKAQETLNNGSKETLQVVFANGTLVLGQGEALTGGQIGGLNLADQTATANNNGSFSVSSNTDTTVAAVDFGGKEASTGTVSITTNGGSATGALVLSGNNGNVFAGLADTTKTVDVTGALTLGNNTEASGNVNAETLKVDNLKVVGTFTANNVTVETSARVDAGAAFTVNSLSGGTTKVSGTLDVTEVKEGAKVQAENGGTVVLTKVAGTVGTPSSRFRVLSLTPEVATGFKLYGTNKNARDIIANSFMTDNDVKDKEVLFLDRVLEVERTGQVNVGATSGTNGAVTVGSSGILVIDARALGAEPIVKGNLKAPAGSGFLLNLNQTGTFALANTAVSDLTFKDDSAFLSAKIENAAVGATDTTSKLVVAFDETAVGDDGELAAAMEAGYANAKNGAVFNAIGATEALFANGKLTEAGQWAASEYVAAPVVAGTYNVAYDAAAEVTRAVMNHNVKGEGMGAWADVFYASNEAKKIYGGQGYSADVYGGVFGFDTVFSCGAKLGAALTIGQADADGERSFSKYSNDADFWGLSVYTGKNVADTSLYIGADLSYLWVDNDLKGTVAGASADESLDSTVFTVGLRADWTAYEGAFNVVPHAGVRYTAIDVDDYRGYASDSINVVELPVGVEVNGTFEASGWKVVPSVDFTIVPQVGDKDVKTAVGNVDVIDNLYNTTVGVEAVYGQYAFGLDAGYGFGSDDRQNATVKANFSYRF